MNGVTFVRVCMHACINELGVQRVNHFAPSLNFLVGGGEWLGGFCCMGFESVWWALSGQGIMG